MNFFEVNKDFHDIELDTSLLGNDYGLSGTPSFDLTDLINDDQSLCNTDYINNNDASIEERLSSSGGNSTSNVKPVAISFKFSGIVDENIDQYGMRQQTSHATVSAPSMLTQIQSKVTEVLTLDSSPIITRNVKAAEEEQKINSGIFKVKFMIVLMTYLLMLTNVYFLCK